MTYSNAAEEGLHVGRTPEVISLTQRQPTLECGRCGSSALDTLQNDARAEIAGQGLDVAHDLFVGVDLLEVGAEVLAHFEEGRLDLLDQREVRVRDAEVVDGQANAGLAQVLHGVDDLRTVDELLLFGDLQDDAMEIHV